MRRINVPGLLFVVLVTLLAEAAVRGFDYTDTVATPSSSLRALGTELWSGELTSEVAKTLEAYVEGLGIAIVIGVAAGVLIGSSRTLLDATSVVIEFVRPIPVVAFIPVLVLFLGQGVAARRFAVAFAVVWPILINTIYGARGVDRMLHDVARTSGVGRVGRIFRVTIPAALPSIATGIRVSAAIALLVCVTAEYLLYTGGVGSYMHEQSATYQLDKLYGAVVLTGVLGYLINVGLRAVERRTLFWAGEERSSR